MIYIVTSNIIVAIVMLFVCFRYSKMFESEVKELRIKLDENANKIDSIEQNSVSKNTEELLREIADLRKDKEREARLRMQAEHEIELTVQKTYDLEKRMEDWQIAQESAIKDTKDEFSRVGKEIYQQFLADFKSQMVSVSPASLAVPNLPTSNSNSATQANEDIIKKLANDLVVMMQKNQYLENKHYFLPSSFSADKAKLFLCELAFISNNSLCIVDLKSARYFAEYERLQAKNKEEAKTVLKQRLDKYFTYLNHAKYYDSIVSVIDLNRVSFKDGIIAVILPGTREKTILQEIGYYDRAYEFGLEVMDIKDFSNAIS